MLLKGLSRDEEKALYLLWVQIRLEEYFKNDKLTPEEMRAAADRAIKRTGEGLTAAAFLRIIDRTTGEDEDEARALALLRSILSGESADFVRIPTGSPLTAFFPSMKPKKPITEGSEGQNRYLQISGTEKDLLQFVDFGSEVQRLLAKSVVIQRVYLLALSKRQPGTQKVRFDFAEYGRACGITNRDAAAKDLLDAVNAIGFFHFAITQTNPQTGKIRSYHIRHLADADFVRTGNGGKDYIEITFSPFACAALDENPGLYGMVPAELFRLSQRESKAFSVGVQLLIQSFRNTKRPGRLSIERLASGLYTTPEERRQKQLFKDPFLGDLALLVREGIFTRITLYRKGKKITAEEAKALPMDDFLSVTVEGIPAKPAAAINQGAEKQIPAAAQN